MGQKAHPKILRIPFIKNWESLWFKKDKPSYKQSLIEDAKIRRYILKKYDKLGIARIRIEREAENISIIIETSKPGFIIGKRGENIEKLRKEIIKLITQERNIRSKNIPVKIEVLEIKKPELEAKLIADDVALAIERRVPFKRAMKQALNKIQLDDTIKGVKIKVSGRLDGSEIASSYWLAKGKIPTSTLKADIDLAHSEAYCRYGVVGVKVWVYKETQKEKEEEKS